MRIAIISNTAWYIFNFRLNLMKALQEAGHAVVAVAPEDAYANRIREAGFEFEGVPISGAGVNPFAELKSIASILRLLHRRRIGLVLSYTPKGNLYSAMSCLVLRVPFVPNVSGLGRAFIRRSLVTWVAQSLYRMTFRRANRVFFQNWDDLNIFVTAGLVGAERAERLPGSGVDLTRFSPKRAPSADGRDPDAPHFLLVARMMWDKGVGEYVEAARSLRSTYPGARFQLLGFLDVANPSAISRRQMDDWVQEGVVDYLGETSDVRPYLAAADCIVLPSYREGVPRTLLEAAATARPVITTDAPGCRDTVIAGETGFLCRPADASDLADKLRCFIALTPTQREFMGLQGRVNVEQKFDERIVIRRYLDTVSMIQG